MVRTEGREADATHSSSSPSCFGMEVAFLPYLELITGLAGGRVGMIHGCRTPSHQNSHSAVVRGLIYRFPVTQTWKQWHRRYRFSRLHHEAMLARPKYRHKQWQNRTPFWEAAAVPSESIIEGELFCGLVMVRNRHGCLQTVAASVEMPLLDRASQDFLPTASCCPSCFPGQRWSVCRVGPCLAEPWEELPWEGSFQMLDWNNFSLVPALPCCLPSISGSLQAACDLLLSPLAMVNFWFPGALSCLLGQRCFMWQGPLLSALPAHLLPGWALPSLYSSSSSCVHAKPPASYKTTKTSHSLISQQRPCLHHAAHRLLFAPYSRETSCVSRQICLLSPQNGTLLASECWPLRFSPQPRGHLPSSCSSIISFYALLRIHFFQKEARWKRSWWLEGLLIKAMLI